MGALSAGSAETPGAPGRSGHGRVPSPPDPLPIAVVDNHTHLDIAREGEDPVDVAEAVAAAAAVGVDRLVQIGCDLPGARFTVEVVDKHDAILGGVALHPNEAPRLAAAGGLDAAYREIEALASHPRVRVVGETGLDYFRTGPEGVGVQQDSFRWHIDLGCPPPATGDGFTQLDRLRFRVSAFGIPATAEVPLDLPIAFASRADRPVARCGG